MKKLFLIAALGAAGLNLATGAAASAPATSKLAVQEVRGTALQQYYASRAAFKAVRGSYDMEDGSKLSLYQHGRSFFAEVSGRNPVEVRAAADDLFVAVDGSAEFRFRQGPAGFVTEVVLSKAPRRG